MASTKRSQPTENIPRADGKELQRLSRLYEARISDLRRLVQVLEVQLETATATNQALLSHLAESQSQIRMAMEEKFFRPVVTGRAPDPKANRFTDEQADDVSQFDGPADAEIMTAERGEDIDAALDRLAHEVQAAHPEMATAVDGFGKERQG